MKIERFVPKPPVTLTMTFTQSEGWALLMALNDAVVKYPGAADRDKWNQWAKDLDRELRR